MEDIRKKSKSDIQKEIQKTMEEIARLTVEAKVNPQRDSNLIVKKKKYIARLKTVASSATE